MIRLNLLSIDYHSFFKKNILSLGWGLILHVKTSFIVYEILKIHISKLTIRKKNKVFPFFGIVHPMLFQINFLE